jgi:hypothetical protein
MTIVTIKIDAALLLKARKRSIARLQKGFDLNWAPSQSREELHEREMRSQHPEKGPVGCAGAK